MKITDVQAIPLAIPMKPARPVSPWGSRHQKQVAIRVQTDEGPTGLGEAFDGTAQRGSELPIFYGEFGVESDIPAAKASLYTGAEPAATRPVSEAKSVCGGAIWV